MFDQAIVRDAKRGHWLRFTDCVDSVSCRDASAVADLFAEIESRCQQESLHAVGYVSYEAAPAFDASLPTQATQLPLIGFALLVLLRSLILRHCQMSKRHRSLPNGA